MDVTKNRQNEETLAKMILNAFPNRTAMEVIELPGGYCNAVYKVTFTDGEKVILKIAPANNCGTLRNEKNLMAVEVQSMKFMQSHPEISVAKVLFSDNSKSICSGDYFFMENMKGENYAEIGDTLSNEEKSVIDSEIGQTEYKFSRIKGKKFGILGQEAYDTLFEFVYALFSNLAKDAQQVSDQVKLPFTPKQLMEKLEKDEAYFSEVTTPSLIHWDLWAGNVFVNDGHISGIIDWERTMWSEPIMSDHFRSHSRTEDFMKGFGKTEFTPTERRRMAWYDIFLFTTMTVEEIFRQYESNHLSEGVRPFLEAAWAEVESNSNSI